jgi:hypothetical protein
MRLPNFGNPASAVFFLKKIIGVYVYIFAFYMFNEIFMRNRKFFGLYFEIFE